MAFLTHPFVNLIGLQSIQTAEPCKRRVGLLCGRVQKQWQDPQAVKPFGVILGTLKSSGTIVLYVSTETRFVTRSKVINAFDLGSSSVMVVMVISSNVQIMYVKCAVEGLAFSSMWMSFRYLQIGILF